MKVENINPTISAEDAYKRGFYYVLMTQTELDGPFLPVTNFYIGDAVVKFATPEDAESHAKDKRYGDTIYGYRIAKVSIEYEKTVENKEAIESTRAMREWWKLWKINREALRLIGKFVVPSYYDTDCWQGYNVGKGKEDGRRC